MRKIVILMFAVMLCILTACDKLGWNRSDNYDSSDSACVAEYVNSLTNPSIMDANEALSLKQSMLEKQSIDSAFLALDNNVLNNVATVLAKRKPGGFHKVDIVYEYQRCKNVYDNLPKSTSNKVDRTGTDLGNRRDSVLSTEISFRNDTINGNPVKIRITKTEQYE